MRVGPDQQITAPLRSADQTPPQSDAGFADTLTSALEVARSSSYYRFVIARRAQPRETASPESAVQPELATSQAGDSGKPPASSEPSDVPVDPSVPAQPLASGGTTVEGASVAVADQRTSTNRPCRKVTSGSPPELSASTYRMFANAFRERGDQATEQYYLDMVPLAREAGVPNVRGVGVLSSVGRWDYNAGAAHYGETGTFDPTSGQGLYCFVPWGGSAESSTASAAKAGSGLADDSES